MRGDLLVTGLAEVATPRGTTPRRGPEQAKVERLRGAEVLCRAGRIAFVGSGEERRRRFGDLDGTPRLDGKGGTLVPGFVDPHTHLVYAGDRREELRRRLTGTSYAEIAAEGGGILGTVVATRAATDTALATVK